VSTPTTLDQVVAAVGAATGVPLEPVYAPPRVGDIAASWADVSRASEIPGYAAAVPFETGIARAVACASAAIGVIVERPDEPVSYRRGTR
jgi:UDP-glucuronate 4-epimerase